MSLFAALTAANRDGKSNLFDQLSIWKCAVALAEQSFSYARLVSVKPAAQLRDNKFEVHEISIGRYALPRPYRVLGGKPHTQECPPVSSRRGCPLGIGGDGC